MLAVTDSIGASAFRWAVQRIILAWISFVGIVTGMTFLLASALPDLASKLPGVSGSTIAAIVARIADLPWWMNLIILPLGGAGVITALIRKFGAKYVIAW